MTPLEIALAAGFLLVSAVPTSPQHVTLANGGFEEVGADGAPADWLAHPTDPRVCKTGTSAKKPLEGNRSGTLECERTESSPGATYLYQVVDIDGCRGRRLLFRAFIRIDRPDRFSRVHLWAHVFGDENESWISDLGDRYVTEDEWTRRDLVFEVPRDATALNVGIRLDGFGTAGIDDASLHGLEAGEPFQAPGPLDEQGLRNLVALTRLMGYVRYFHPSDGAAEADWDSFAILGVRALEGVESIGELAERLEGLFRPIAPTIQVFPSAEPPPLPAALLAPPEEERRPRVVVWSHNGLGRPGGMVYSSYRKRSRLREGQVRSGIQPVEQPFEADLGPGLRCRVPLTLYLDRHGTVPSSPDSVLEPVPILASPDDRASRLAAVALGWNVMQHFYPYFDEVEVDWRAALEEALRGAAEDRGSREFFWTLRSLVAKLRDGHAWVESDRETDNPSYTPAIRWEWIEGRIVLTEVDENLEGTVPYVGDVVLSIEGRPVEGVLADAGRFAIGATAAARRHSCLRDILRGDEDEPLALRVESPAGEQYELVLPRTHYGPIAETELPVVHELEPGYLYVDIDRLTVDDLEGARERLEGAEGIVLDLRGYPRAPILAAHLTDDSLTSPTWLTPRPARPDRIGGLDFSASTWELGPLEPRLHANVAFITNVEAQSAAETYLSFVEQFHLAEIVGEPSAGTNGNINRVSLPGGYEITWTGMKVLKQDGSQHHGVGILPTVPVSRTRAGVVDGRDELLDAALELVKRDPEEFQRGLIEKIRDPRERGAACAARYEFELAVEAFTEAIDAAPDDSELYVDRAFAYLALGRLEEARADFSRTIELDPSNAMSYSQRGLLRGAAGDDAGALEDLNRGVELDPEESTTFVNRGHYRYSRGDWNEALRDFEQAEELHPDSLWEVQLYAWLIRTRLGEREAATDELLDLLDDAEERDWVWEMFEPTAQFLVGELSEEEYFAATMDTPEATALEFCLACFYAASKRLLDGDPTGAAELFRHAVESDCSLYHEYWTATAELRRLDG